MATWPTVELDRPIVELRLTADEIQRAIEDRAAAEAAQKRANKLAKMADDPKPYLDQTEKLVAQRTTDAYGKIARLLADLREALAERGQIGLAEQQAETLSKKYPSLRNLKSALRREGFVPKQVHGRKVK